MPLTALPKSLFLHIPRTGGNWVTHAAFEGVQGMKGSVNDPYDYRYGHGSYKKAREDGFTDNRFVFMFVRDPLDWLMSYWRRRMHVDWHPVGDDKNPWDLYELCADGDFNKFVDKVIDTPQTRGLVGKIFDWFRYDDKGDEGPSYVGRYEDLVSDFIHAISAAGETFDEARIRGIPPINPSNYEKFPAEYKPHQRTALLELEQNCIQKYGYE